MRRKQPSTVLTVAGEDVPRWVLEAGSHTAAFRRFGPSTGLGPTEFRRMRAGSLLPQVQAHQQDQLEAAQEWCAQRGISFTMTVLGTPQPTSEEAAAGCTRGAGPRYATTLRATGNRAEP